MMMILQSKIRSDPTQYDPTVIELLCFNDINTNNIDMEVFSEKCSYSNDFNFSLISNFLKILKNDRIDKFETINCENNYN